MANTRDVLAVDLVVNGEQAAKKSVDNFVANLESADKKINDLGSNVNLSALNSQLAAADKSALDLRRSLSDVILAAQKSDSPIWRTYVTGAKLAQKEAQRLTTEIKEIRAAASRTTDPVLFKQLQTQAAAAEAAIDKLEKKVKNVTAGRAAAQGRTGAGGANGRGLLGAASAIGIPGAFEAEIGLDAAAASGLSAAALASIAAAGAAIFAAKKITDAIRENAEQQLKTEEKISFAYSQQGLELAKQKKIAEEFNQVRERAAGERRTDERQAFAEKAGGGRLSILRDELIASNALERKYAALNKALSGKEIDEGTAAQLKNNETRILELDKLIEKSKSTGFSSDDSEKNAKFFSDAAERRKKEFEDFEKAKAKIDEIAKASKDMFAEIFAKSGENNPFVKVFSDAAESIEKAKLQTANFNDEIKKTALNLTETANANALFAVRLETNLRSSDLRADADRFRKGGDKNAEKLADQFLQDTVARYRREESQGLFRNPANLLQFTGGISAAGRLKFFDEQRAQNERDGLFKNPDIQEDTRRRLALAAVQEPLNADATARDRFERQLEVVKKLKPENDAQRAEADRKIIALGGNLDPASLSDGDRSAIAQALENEAVRTENAETTAKAERDQLAKIQSSIDANIGELLKIARSEGLTGVIRIVNEAENQAKVSLGKRPTEKDMSGRTDL